MAHCFNARFSQNGNDVISCSLHTVSCEGLLGVTKDHAVMDSSSFFDLCSDIRSSSQFKTAALTDRLPVAHPGSNFREAGREKYALTCQSYPTKLSSHTEAPFFLANPFLSFSRPLTPVFRFHYTFLATVHLTKCEITGK